MRILVVEDELAMRTALIHSLRRGGYRAEGVGDGEECLAKVFSHEFDLVLLDVMMPKIDGFTACAEMRKRGLKIPILMLTARGTVDDRVQGLDSGADDYLMKPFSLKELLARVRALTRKVAREEVPENIVIGDAHVNLKTRVCLVGGTSDDLSSKECGILRLLLASRGEIVSREKFLDDVWGYDASPTSRTVDNFILKLRKKLGGKGASLLKSIRGEGYRIDEE